MELDVWRRQNDYSVAQLAESLGICGRNPARTVHRYLTFERIPDRGTIRKIEDLTKGLVSDADFPVHPVQGPSFSISAPGSAA